MGTRFLVESRKAPVQFECKTIQGRILQNVRNLLMTRMGEVPYDRLRGLNPDVYDKPVAFVKAHIGEEITRVLAWEPDVQLVGVEVKHDKDGTYFLCEVEVSEDPEERARIRL